MTDLEREERAFRKAFADHAGEATSGRTGETLTLVSRPPRRWWLLSVAAALVVGVAVLPFLMHQREKGAGQPTGPSTGATAPAGDWRWVAFRDIEVRVPADWAYANPPLRPDCITRGDASDPWARDVPRAPYVSVGIANTVVPAVGCSPVRKAGDPPKAFGDLPFKLWQPHVQLTAFHSEWQRLTQVVGRWSYHGWKLSRDVLHGVVVSVLAPPGQSNLVTQVVDSARTVTRTTLGCDPASPAQRVGFARPDSGDLPAPEEVTAVTLCEYARTAGYQGLEGTRQLTGSSARRLVEAIRRAPATPGPNRPDVCTESMSGFRALALVFQGAEGKRLAEAYVYFDWCFGNGIFTKDGVHRLTRADCQPLFAEPPITYYTGDAATARLCGTDHSG